MVTSKMSSDIPNKYFRYTDGKISEVFMENIRFAEPEHVTEAPKVLLPKVALVAKSIVSILKEHGTSVLILFEPTSETFRLVRDNSGLDVDLSIEDVNGLFTPNRAQHIVGYTYERGNDTMIVELEVQN